MRRGNKRRKYLRSGERQRVLRPDIKTPPIKGKIDKLYFIKLKTFAL